MEESKSAASASVLEPVRTAGPLPTPITRALTTAKALYVPVVHFTHPMERKRRGPNQRWQAPSCMHAQSHTMIPLRYLPYFERASATGERP
ncbi:hypothetical protein ACWGXJ_26470 [Paenibacillus sp. S33]